MRHMLVTCANGDKFDVDLEDDDQLEITKRGKLRLTQPGFEPTVKKLDSPAVSIHELVPVAGDL